jgi:hypothetical protein
MKFSFYFLMKYFQKLVSGCLSLALMMGMFIPSFAFSQYSSYEDAVQINEVKGQIQIDSQYFFPDTAASSREGRAAAYLHGLGIIGGFPDGEFKGDRLVNRAELAKFLLLASVTEVGDLKNNGTFPDIKEGEWYMPFVMKAHERGVINGYPDGFFRPEKSVNTAEALKMTTKAFSLKENRKHNYTDVNFSDWFDKYAGIASFYTLFPERSDTLLEPEELLTRNEVAVMIYQYFISTSSEDNHDSVSDVPPSPGDDHTPLVENGLSVFLSSQTPSQQNIPTCSKDVVFTKFDMEAGSEDVRLDTITVTRIGLGDNDDFYNIRIERNGKVMTDEKSFNNDDIVEFHFPSYFQISGGDTETFNIVADLKCSRNDTNVGHHSSFVIRDVSSITSSASITLGNFPIEGNDMQIVEKGQQTSSSIPRISFWYGKVNQYNDNGVWKTDPTGMRGAGTREQWGDEGWGDRKLEYCQLFWPETTSVQEFMWETISPWCEKGNINCTYTSTKLSYECVQGEELPDILVSRDPSNPGNMTYSSGASDVVALIARTQTKFDEPVLVDGLILRVDSSTKIFDENGNETNDISYLQDYFKHIRFSLNDVYIDTKSIKGTTVDNAYVEFNITFEIRDIDQLEFELHIGETSTNGSKLKMSLSAQDLIGPEYLSTGDPVPEENLVGSAMGSFLEVQNSFLQISSSGDIQDRETIIAGLDDVSMLQFLLGNNDGGAVNISTILMKAKGTGNAIPYTNFMGAIFIDGTQRGSAKSLNTTGEATFNDISIVVPSAGQKEFTLLVNTTESSANGTITFFVTEALAENIETGNDIETFNGDELLSENNPVSGTQFQLIKSGKLSVQRGSLIPGRVLQSEEEAVDLLNVEFRALYDDISVRKIYLINDLDGDRVADDPEVSALLNFKLYNETGQLIQTKQMSGEGTLYFELANQDRINVDENGTQRVSIKGDVRALNEGNSNLKGAQLRLVLDQNPPYKGIEAITMATGSTIDTPANGWGTAKSEIFAFAWK